MEKRIKNIEEKLEELSEKLDKVGMMLVMILIKNDLASAKIVKQEKGKEVRRDLSDNDMSEILKSFNPEKKDMN